MGYTVKSEEQEQAEEARFSKTQDDMFGAIGMTRADFNCFEGIAPDDEHIIVWSSDEAHFVHEPRNLVSGGWNAGTGHWEYAFLPVDTFAGGPTVGTY